MILVLFYPLPTHQVSCYCPVMYEIRFGWHNALSDTFSFRGVESYSKVGGQDQNALKSAENSGWANILLPFSAIKKWMGNCPSSSNYPDLVEWGWKKIWHHLERFIPKKFEKNMILIKLNMVHSIMMECPLLLFQFPVATYHVFRRGKIWPS